MITESRSIHFFNITEKNTEFQLYTDTFSEFSFEELNDELEELLNISDTTPSHLRHELMGPRVIQS